MVSFLGCEYNSGSFGKWTSIKCFGFTYHSNLLGLYTDLLCVLECIVMV